MLNTKQQGSTRDGLVRVCVCVPVCVCVCVCVRARAGAVVWRALPCRQGLESGMYRPDALQQQTVAKLQVRAQRQHAVRCAGPARHASGGRREQRCGAHAPAGLCVNGRCAARVRRPQDVFAALRSAYPRPKKQSGLTLVDTVSARKEQTSW
jgi:hypothetical protein